MCPAWELGKPLTSTSYRIKCRGVESEADVSVKVLLLKYQHGPQVRTQPTLRSSPTMCRIISAGATPCVGDE